MDELLLRARIRAAIRRDHAPALVVREEEPRVVRGALHRSIRIDIVMPAHAEAKPVVAVFGHHGLVVRPLHKPQSPERIINILEVLAVVDLVPHRIVRPRVHRAARARARPRCECAARPLVGLRVRVGREYPIPHARVRAVAVEVERVRVPVAGLREGPELAAKAAGDRARDEAPLVGVEQTVKPVHRVLHIEVAVPAHVLIHVVRRPGDLGAIIPPEGAEQANQILVVLSRRDSPDAILPFVSISHEHSGHRIICSGSPSRL